MRNGTGESLYRGSLDFEKALLVYKQERRTQELQAQQITQQLRKINNGAGSSNPNLAIGAKVARTVKLLQDQRDQAEQAGDTALAEAIGESLATIILACRERGIEVGGRSPSTQPAGPGGTNLKPAITPDVIARMPTAAKFALGSALGGLL